MLSIYGTDYYSENLGGGGGLDFGREYPPFPPVLFSSCSGQYKLTDGFLYFSCFSVTFFSLIPFIYFVAR